MNTKTVWLRVCVLYVHMYVRGVCAHANTPNADDYSSILLGVTSTIFERSRLFELWSNNSVPFLHESNTGISIITTGRARSMLLFIWNEFWKSIQPYSGCDHFTLFSDSLYINCRRWHWSDLVRLTRFLPASWENPATLICCTWMIQNEMYTGSLLPQTWLPSPCSAADCGASRVMKVRNSIKVLICGRSLLLPLWNTSLSASLNKTQCSCLGVCTWEGEGYGQCACMYTAGMYTKVCVRETERQHMCELYSPRELLWSYFNNLQYVGLCTVGL